MPIITIYTGKAIKIQPISPIVLKAIVVNANDNKVKNILFVNNFFMIVLFFSFLIL
jgi:hypothetical protein